MKEIRSIVYVGIYPAKAPRDNVYLAELKKRGVVLYEFVSSAPGLAKYRELYRNLRREATDSDAIWVGYLSPMVVPVAYLARGKRKIVYNALGSAYEAYVLDRAVCKPYSFKALSFWFFDFLSFHLAHTILVESEAQRRFLAKTFFVSLKKLVTVYTSVDEEIFHPDPQVRKQETFAVMFRGMFIPATGVEIVLEAAKLLKDEPIRFIISGWGQLKDEVVSFIERNKLKNVELNTVFLEPDALRGKLLSAHVLLGQFSTNTRLERTIQHKNSEALALGQPLITRDSASNREVFEDGVNCLFVRAGDAEALAEKIIYAREHPEVLKRLATGAFQTYREKLSAQVLGEQISSILKSHV